MSQWLPVPLPFSTANVSIEAMVRDVVAQREALSALKAKLCPPAALATRNSSPLA
jgi:hypothetical protein